MKRISWLSWSTLLFSVLAAGTLAARGGWTDPPGGWDYVYEANAGEGIYAPIATGNMVTGLLDGSWIGGSRTYFWDGSAPGVFAAADPDGDAPGGAVLAEYVALGEGGSRATVLSIEVAGDTTVTAGNPFDFAWNTPANEAVAFFRGFTRPDDDTVTFDTKTGITVIARWRLKPNPIDVENPGGGRPWRGASFTADGKGMISIVDQDAVNMSLSIDDEGKLMLMDQFELPFAASPTAFLSTWMSVALTDTDTYLVHVYLNGSSTPAFSQEIQNPLDGDEAGTSPDDYMSFGLPVVGEAGAMELDYIGYKGGFLRPGDPAVPPNSFTCTVDGAADPVTLNLGWVIPAGAAYDSIEILRNDVLLATVNGDEVSYATPDIVTGDWVYGLRAVVGGNRLQPVTCLLSYCPVGAATVVIAHDRTPRAAHVTWGTPGFPVQNVELSRANVLLATLPAGTTEYFDESLTPDVGQVQYQVDFIPVAGFSCNPATTRTIIMPPVEKPFRDPPGGWDFVFNPDAHTAANRFDRYVAEKGVEGALDGTWIRSNLTDFWDGSAPGASAPGGVEILDRPGEGAGGESIKTLSIEDPGDPRDDGYADPSNRKIYLARLLEAPGGDPAASRLEAGVTMLVRFRLTPDPRDVADPPQGQAVRDSSHGQITLCYYDGDPAADAATGPSKSWGMSLNNDTLDISSGGDINGFEPGEWVSVWVTHEDADVSGFYHSQLFVNGNTVPIRPDWRSELDGWEELIFVDDTIPFNAIVMGMLSTDDDGAIEIDYIKVKYGEFFPEEGSGGGELFFRGEINQDGSVNIADAISLLGHLFGGQAAPGCPDAADTNDDGRLNIADAITLLGHLFGGAGPLPLPSGLTCGPDPSDDELGPCTFVPCER